MGAVLACFQGQHDRDPAACVRRMAAMSPYRGEVEVWAAANDAIAVQNMGWDASLAWGGGWVVAVHGYVGDWGTAAPAGASRGALAKHVLALLAELGPSCVAQLRGEFALLAYHRPSQLLYLARDFFGKRPLFYALAQGRLVVASEIRQVAVGAELPGELDAQMAVQCVAGLDVPADRTEYTGIRRAAPATIYTLACEGSPREVGRESYWRPPEERSESAQATAGDRAELGRLLRQAVQRALVGAGPVAVGVSSGVDSAALWALLCQQRKRDGFEGHGDLALSFVFPGLPCDETEGIRALHAWCGTCGCEIDASGESPFHRTSYLIERCDRLTHPMAFTIGLLAEQAAARGVRVLLTAHGPDEFLAGRLTYLLDLFARGNLWAFVRDCLSIELRRTSRGRFLAQQITAAVRQFWRRSRRPPPPWLSQQAWAAIEARRSATRPHGSRYSSQIRAYVAGYQAGGGLDGFEQLAARAGVEHRNPLLDQDLLDFALTLPGRVLLGGRRLKWLLRETLADELPDSLRHGWKVSFDCMLERDSGAAADRLRAAAAANPAAVARLQAEGLDIMGLLRYDKDALALLQALGVVLRIRSGPAGEAGWRKRKGGLER